MAAPIGFDSALRLGAGRTRLWALGLFAMGVVAVIGAPFNHWHDWGALWAAGATAGGPDLVDAARQQLTSGRALLDLAGRQQKSIAAQIQAGATEPLDLLNAEMETNAIRLAQLESEAQLQTALGALEDALQHPADNFDAAKFLKP